MKMRACRAIKAQGRVFAGQRKEEIQISGRLGASPRVHAVTRPNSPSLPTKRSTRSMTPSGAEMDPRHSSQPVAHYVGTGQTRSPASPGREIGRPAKGIGRAAQRPSVRPADIHEALGPNAAWPGIARCKSGGIAGQAASHRGIGPAGRIDAKEKTPFGLDFDALAHLLQDNPHGREHARSASKTCTAGSVSATVERTTPPSGVALPVRFDLPPERVTRIPAERHARKTMATCRSFLGRANASAAPGKWLLSLANPDTMSWSSTRSQPKRSRKNAAKAGSASSPR